MKSIDILRAAEKYLEDGFTPQVLPGCANFVSRCLVQAGWSYGVYNYTTDIVDKCDLIDNTKKQPGDIVLFKKTYDAVPPAGIGDEDDMTHIAVYTGNNEFIDFGGSPPGMRRLNLNTPYWKEHFQMFVRPKEIENNEYETVKIFHNINGTNIVTQSGKNPIVSLEMIIKYKKF